MNKDVPVTNGSAIPQSVGGYTILPGETRILPEHHVPGHIRHELRVAKDNTEAAPVASPKNNDASQASEAIAEILAQTVPAITAMMPGMTSDELDKLSSAEEQGQARTGILKAISEQRLIRASEDEAAKEADEYAKLIAEMSDREIKEEIKNVKDEGIRGILQAEIERRTGK